MLKNLAALVVFSVALLALVWPAIATPPQGPAITTAVAGPLAAAEEIVTGTVAVTVSSALATIPGGAPSVGLWGLDSITQNVVITSDTSNTTRMCLKAVKMTPPVAAANDTCAEVCATLAGGDMTCSGAATDGIWLDPGQSIVQRHVNQFCYCGEAASGTPRYQLRRAAR